MGEARQVAWPPGTTTRRLQMAAPVADPKGSGRAASCDWSCWRPVRTRPAS